MCVNSYHGLTKESSILKTVWNHQFSKLYKSALKGYGYDFGQQYFSDFNVYNASGILNIKQSKLECLLLGFKRVTVFRILCHKNKAFVYTLNVEVKISILDLKWMC